MHNFPTSLLSGYANFMQNSYAEQATRYENLADEGQTPETMIIGCCDSRAAPETIFDCGPGELFVLRNVANLVPKFEPDSGQHGTSAAIEFAVQGLKVKNIVVMGHGRCGGINAALNPINPPLAQGDFIGKWMSLLDPVTKQFPDDGQMSEAERQTALERISVHNSIRNLRTFPYISALEKEAEIRLHGAWFDIKSGELWIMDHASGEFSRPRI
ncbi:MAG: carbonic anhydrase [Devosiaceae bacterium]|nr:carbonic anhydrase [Devosiaceae bacterium]